MQSFIKALTTVFVLTISSISLAEVVVIVNPSSGITILTVDDISRIFLGKLNTFPGGAQAISINQEEGSAVRNKFNETICKKSASQYKAYWSQLVFTGKATSPKNASDDVAVKKLIAANTNMIGYIDSSAVDATVKVVYKIP